MWPFLDARSTDVRCLDSTGALLLDGANGVCGEARLGAGTGGWAHLLALLLAALTIAALLRWRPRAWVALAVAMSLAALPGAYAALVLRADRAVAARQATVLHDRLRAFAFARGCARVTRNRCEACFPIARLALTDLRCAAPASIKLRADALSGLCEVRGRALVCGQRR